MTLTGHAMSILDSYVHGFAQQEASLPLDASGDIGGATKDIVAQQEQTVQSIDLRNSNGYH
jgi:hypothetical protein